MKQNIYVVYRYDKTTKTIDFKTFNQFDRILHNADRDKYYYFNYNMKDNVLENPYCCIKTPEMKKISKKIYNMHLITLIFVLYKEEATKIRKLEQKLYSNSKILEKEAKIKAKKEYEESRSNIKEVHIPVGRLCPAN